MRRFGLNGPIALWWSISVLADGRRLLREHVAGFVEDDDGCPDKPEIKVKVTAEGLDILEKVYFDTGKATLQKRSFQLLDQITLILQKRPDITHLSIEGHTDAQGGADKNMALSQGRAESVKNYIVSKGIAAERLDAKGFGQTVPVETNDTPAGREANRRVEFKITEEEKSDK